MWGTEGIRRNRVQFETFETLLVVLPRVLANEAGTSDALAGLSDELIKEIFRWM
jgi:hypothetical protein